MPTRLAEDTDLTALQSLLDLDEIIEPESPGYIANCQTWAAQKQCSPRLIVRPTSVESLSRTIRHYSTKLDFAIYGHGFMSASTKDVLVNISSFDDFNFDRSSKSITLRAGQTWEQVYQKLEEEAPAYAVVGARTPAVGVAGTILNGGWSWLSGEYGCISDPINFLDVQVAKYDGSVVYASAEPDLLWALRGGGGFGVLVNVVLRVFPYPQDIWAGPILVPREHLEQVAEGVERLACQHPDPKVTMFLYVLKKKTLQSIVPTADSDMMVIHAFDANGEAHGRASLKWALDLPGMIDQTRISTLAGVAQLQCKVSTVKETMTQFWGPMVLLDIPKETIIKAVEWTEDLQSIAPNAPTSSLRCFSHETLLDLYRRLPGQGPPVKKMVAPELAIEVPGKVLGSDAEVNFLPNGFEEYHDPKKIWGPHFTKVQAIRRQYNPQCRVKGPVKCKGSVIEP